VSRRLYQWQPLAWRYLGGGALGRRAIQLRAWRGDGNVSIAARQTAAVRLKSGRYRHHFAV